MTRKVSDIPDEALLAWFKPFHEGCIDLASALAIAYNTKLNWSTDEEDLKAIRTTAIATVAQIDRICKLLIP